MFKSRYYFYDLSNNKQRKLVGQCFTEDRLGSSVYFPVLLNKNEFNYGKRFGLICISRAFTKYQAKHLNYFTICATSPDDLDIGIYPSGPPHLIESLHKKAMDWLHSVPKQDVFYSGILKECKAYLSINLPPEISIGTDGL